MLAALKFIAHEFYPNICLAVISATLGGNFYTQTPKIMKMQ